MSPEAGFTITSPGDDEFLQHVLEGAQDGAWDWNIVTGEVRFNEEWARMLGYELRELPPHVSTWEKLVHPDDMPHVMASLTAHLEGRAESYVAEHRLLARDGSWVWILDRGRVIQRDADGRPVRAAGMHFDITPRKRAELALSESEERYRGLVESQRDLIVRVDVEGRFTFVNDAYCAMFGKTREELVGHSFAPLVHPDDLPKTLAAMRELMAPPHRVVVDQRAMTAHGWRWLSWEDYAITDSGGTVREIQAIGRDVTERKQIEEHLIAQNELAQRVSEAHTLVEALTASLDVAMRVGQMECGGIYLTEGGGHRLEFVASRGFPNSIYEWARNWGKGRAHAELVDLARPSYLADIPRHVTQHEAVLNEHVRSVAVLPIVEQSRPIGALLLASRTWDEVPMLSRSSLESIALQTAVHVRRIRDEEGARRTQKSLEDKLREANRTLNERLGELKQYAYEARLLSEMASMLQVCLHADEAYRVVERQLGLLFPAERGVLYVVSPESRELVPVARWGANEPQFSPFEGSECWGMRRGQPHLAVDGTLDLRCAHSGPDTGETTLCVPLVAQGETLGLLHIRSELGEIPAAKQDVAQMVADKIALALSNVSLRESLRQQSLRDPLTGLFNRRLLQESLRFTLARAERTGTPVSLVMVDVDHFKALNDTCGHDAGDVALREIASLLSRSVREGDVACRYGGEEFLLVLWDSDTRAARLLAERVRQAVAQLRPHLAGRTLGPITVSAGVSCSRDFGSNTELLLRAADEALYRAKAAGRDRVESAGPGTDDRAAA